MIQQSSIINLILLKWSPNIPGRGLLDEMFVSLAFSR